MRQRIWQFLAILAAFGVVLGWRAAPAARAQSPDVLGALLVEVRGLRVAMEQMASAGPRVQLATARLQLQEQRVNALLRRLDDVRANIRNTEEEIASMSAQYRQFEQAVGDVPNRAEVEQELKSRKAAMTRRGADLQRLQVEEAQAGQEIAIEQARWNDINQRLDELDRALTRR